MAGESELRRFFYLVGSLALVGVILYWARPVLVPVTTAVLAAFVLAPIVARLERMGLPRFIASGATIFCAGVLLVAIAHTIVQQMGPLAEDLSSYKEQIVDKIGVVRKAAADSWLGDMADFANDLGRKPPAEAPASAKKDDTFVARIEIPVVAIVQSVAGTVAEILLNAVLVFMLALLLLVRREDVRNRVIQLLGSSHRISATRALDDASKRVSRFLLMQLLVNLGFGVIVALGLRLIDVPHPLVWGALAGLLRYIPYLGGWLAAVCPLLASMVLPTWTPFFLTLAFFVIVELLQANLVEPLAFGHSIGVSGPGQVVAMLFWATLWGPVGLILSTPLTACLCVLGHHFRGLRFFSTLMGDGEIVDRPDAFYQRLVAGDTVEATSLAEAFLKERSAVALVDEMLIPALLAARFDHRHGELSDDDRQTIGEAVREIFAEVVATRENAGAGAEQAPVEEAEKASILVIDFPFNDDIDELVSAMLKALAPGGRVRWSTASIADSALEEMARRQDGAPRFILIATTALKNLARLRGACRTVDKLFPQAEKVACCWCLDSETDAAGLRLTDAGADVVCTKISRALEVIDSGAPK
jgi:predicted PurR-regulated permease PerM